MHYVHTHFPLKAKLKRKTVQKMYIFHLIHDSALHDIWVNLLLHCKCMQTLYYAIVGLLYSSIKDSIVLVYFFAAIPHCRQLLADVEYLLCKTGCI